MPRPLGSMEYVFWLLNRSVGNQIVLAAEIEGTATAETWRHAFDALRRRHPLLSVRLPATSSGTPYMEVMPDQSIPLRHVVDADWTAEGVAPEWLNRAIAHELNEPFDTDVAPLMRAVLATGPRQSVLILACNHAISDGISLSYCIRDLLKALNGEVLEPMPLPLSGDELCGDAPPQPRGAPISLEGIRFPRDVVPVVQRLSLSRELTQSLVQRARADRTTLHGMLCAALLHSGRNATPEWRERPVVILSPVDMRLQWGIEDDCGCFLTSAAASLGPAPDQTLWETARAAVAGLNAAAARESVRESTRRLRDMLEGGLDAAGAVRLRQTAIARDVMVTNLGNIRFDPTLGPFRLTALWGPLAMSGYPGNHTVGVSTVNGNASLTLASRVPPPRFLEYARDLLFDACAR
ncbi:phthiocerol/phthiodiolone dimycocerosyl transferase family protein [Paraburkholderia humisilvae]|nr:condensation domain-containing protein [Paraburkholderia humisilvae]